MIDLDHEKLVTLKEAVMLVPTVQGRGPIVPRTLYNWAARGRNGVVLESVPIGGVLVTSKEALDRFFAQLAAARQQRFMEHRHNGPNNQGRPRSLRRRQTDIAAVRKRLAEQHGV